MAEPIVVRAGSGFSPEMVHAARTAAQQTRRATVDVLEEQSGLDPQRLELEITEGVLLRDTDETLVTLEQLRALGVRLALDDFGTGYASLGYLLKFRFDKVKIDRSFVRNLGVDHAAAAIVRAVIGLCEDLDMSTIAEGVENADQIAMLRAQGCREAQGFLYWAPMSAHALHRVIEQQRKVA